MRPTTLDAGRIVRPMAHTINLSSGYFGFGGIPAVFSEASAIRSCARIARQPTTIQKILVAMPTRISNPAIPSRPEPLLVMMFISLKVRICQRPRLKASRSTLKCGSGLNRKAASMPRSEIRKRPAGALQPAFTRGATPGADRVSRRVARAAVPPPNR